MLAKTLTEYYREVQALSRAEFPNILNGAQMEFAAAKQIELSDVQHLHRVFDQTDWGEYMSESGETLKAILKEYYAADISALEALAD